MLMLACLAASTFTSKRTLLSSRMKLMDAAVLCKAGDPRQCC